MLSTVSGNCNLDLKTGLNNQPCLSVTVLGFSLVDFLLYVESLSISYVICFTSHFLSFSIFPPFSVYICVSLVH